MIKIAQVENNKYIPNEFVCFAATGFTDFHFVIWRLCIFIQAPFPNYNPPAYTSDSVKRNPPWADEHIMSK
jgi:hypothetical protein